MTKLGLDAEGLTETISFELGIFLFVFVFSPLMRQWQNYFTGTNTRIGG
jgi:hypothetical protein